MKSACALIACLAAAACDGTSSNTSTPAPYPVTSPSGSVLPNATLVTDPATLANLATDSTDPSQVALSYIFVDLNPGVGDAGLEQTTPRSAVFSSDGNQLTISIGSASPITLTWSAANSAYVYSAGDGYGSMTCRIYADPANPDNRLVKIFYSGATTGDLTANPTEIDYAALVPNPTPGTLFQPGVTGGIATYSGTVEVTDQKFDSAGGTITLQADVAAATITGSIDVNKGTVFGAGYQLSLGSGAIAKGATSTSFSSTLDGSGASGLINGTFSGSRGQDVAGAFFVNGTSSGNSLAGVFSAAN